MQKVCMAVGACLQICLFGTGAIATPVVVGFESFSPPENGVLNIKPPDVVVENGFRFASPHMILADASQPNIPNTGSVTLGNNDVLNEPMLIGRVDGAAFDMISMLAGEGRNTDTGYFDNSARSIIITGFHLGGGETVITHEFDLIAQEDALLDFEWLDLSALSSITRVEIQGTGGILNSFFTIDDVTFRVIDPSLTGDLDSDGFVGIADLNIVLGNWNQNVAAGDPLVGDPSGDGFVGINDLNTVLGNWNAGTPPTGGANIPEPGTLALAVTGLMLMNRRR